LSFAGAGAVARTATAPAYTSAKTSTHVMIAETELDYGATHHHRSAAR
jgi:hypothetical protein